MNASDHDHPYSVQPLEFRGSVPIFSQGDFYIENYERIAADHLAHLSKTGNNPFIDEESWKDIESSTATLLEHYSRDGLRVLDVGVGLGRLLGRFPSLDRYGMDISMKYLKHASSRGIKVCMAKVEDMPYKADFFDLVVCTDVLEHVLDLNLAVGNILSVLKPGGTLIVRVPFKEDLARYLDETYPYELVHLRNFDEHCLTLLFEKIFRTQVLKHDFCGHRNGRLRFGKNIRFYNSTIRRLLNLTSRLNLSFHLRLSKLFCEPVEINVVVRKPVDRIRHEKICAE